LPYVSALAKEVLRCEQVTPLGVPHLSLRDDESVYDGYTIPAGTTMIPNQWAMSHDTEAYPSPLSFARERFLSTPAPRSPNTIAFGFGRRVCPGRRVAEDALWIHVATTLACFEVRRGAEDVVPPPRYLREGADAVIRDAVAGLT
ncbi:cytochrome P450, partial [Vararia minispora EC-137]